MRSCWWAGARCASCATPGWSRRAQYGLFFSFLAVIAGVLIGLLLLGLSVFAPSAYAGVRGAEALGGAARLALAGPLETTRRAHARSKLAGQSL